jgi:hypothetical protein
MIGREKDPTSRDGAAERAAASKLQAGMHDDRRLAQLATMIYIDPTRLVDA